MDMKRFATCSRADPTTCFEASNAQILTGRWGLSRHLLKTRDNSASRPSAPCMKRANGPSSLHSPFSAPGRTFSWEVELEAALGVLPVEVGFRRIVDGIKAEERIAVAVGMIEVDDKNEETP